MTVALQLGVLTKKKKFYKRVEEISYFYLAKQWLRGDVTAECKYIKEH